MKQILPQTEAGIQQAIKEALEWRGYVVLETSERRKRCPNCGEWNHRGSGVSRAISDLLVGRRGSPLLLAMEIKKPGGRLSLEQQAALEEGRIRVARSVEEALAIAEEF